MPEEKNTKFCSNCGAEIDIKAKICPKCGVEQPIIPEKVSNWWYLPPIFLGIIGGLVAWIVNKDVNPKKAKKLLIIGIVLPIVYIITYFGIMASIVLVSMGGAREAARDAARKADMRMIVAAQEMYYAVNNVYYTSVNYPSRIGPHMPETPTDPKTEGPYGWIDNTGNNQKFCAYADLEKNGFFVATHKGVGEIATRPFTLSACEKFLRFFETPQKEESEYSQERLPRFEDFPIPEQFKGTPAPVDFLSHPSAPKFKTRLTEGAKEGPNFAGHYTIVSWGCGTMCQVVSVIDAQTGTVYFPPFITELGSEFRIDSNLFIVNPPDMIKEIFGGFEIPNWVYSAYYKWENNQFISIYDTGIVD